MIRHRFVSKRRSLPGAAVVVEDTGTGVVVTAAGTAVVVEDAEAAVVVEATGVVAVDAALLWVVVTGTVR